MTYIILVCYIFTSDITYLSFAAIARCSIPVEKPPAFLSDLLPNLLGVSKWKYSVRIRQLCLRTPAHRALRCWTHCRVWNFPWTTHQGTHQSMLADPTIWSLPRRLGPEEGRTEYPMGRGRGDCDAAHEILKTNIYHIHWWYILNIYLVYDIIEKWKVPCQHEYAIPSIHLI
jgi:hypothetical protein